MREGAWQRRRLCALRAPPVLAGLVLLNLVWGVRECSSQQLYTLEMDHAHCGKKFRIATHVMPPFVMLDVAKCTEQKCGPEAFGDNGGVVYKLMMEHVLPQLQTYCKVRGTSLRADALSRS